MGTARVNVEEKADTRIISEELQEIWKKRTWARGGSPKQELASAKDFTIMLPEGRESPYHGSN